MSMKRVFARAIPHHSLDPLYSKVAKNCTYISIYFSHIYVSTKQYAPYKKISGCGPIKYTRLYSQGVVAHATARILRLSANNTVRFVKIVFLRLQEIMWIPVCGYCMIRNTGSRKAI
jgi:hypothetical protein